MKIVTSDPENALQLLTEEYPGLNITQDEKSLLLTDCEIEPSKVNLFLAQHNILVEGIGAGENALERYYLKVTKEAEKREKAGARS